MTKRQKQALGWLCAGAAAVAVGIGVDNRRIEIEPITVTLPDLPDAFRGCRIAVVADIHIPRCVRSPEALEQLLKKQQPDYILMPGDLIVDDDFDRTELTAYAQAVAAVAPAYAVEGNHERRSRADTRAAWAACLSDAGITVLHDEAIVLTRDGQELTLAGLSSGTPFALPEGTPRPVLAMAHYPENLPAYAAASLDLVVAGHAHGGQIRLFGQGLFSPGEGFFPQYTSGLYQQDTTHMVVSRGLCFSPFPFRVGNCPHLPLITLEGI